MRALALGFVWLTASACGGARLTATRDSGARDAVISDPNEPDADAPGSDTPQAEVDGDGDGDGRNSCVGVTGGGLKPWLDLRIVGRQFDAYEGRHLRIVVSNGRGNRLGVAEVAIASGAFEQTLPGTFNYSSYAEIALYVDDDADQTCDVGEPLWGLVTGGVQDNLLVEATPDGPCLSGGGPSMFKGCTSWRPPVGPCAINGQADLAMRLPCPP